MDNELLLFDRLEVIKTTIQTYGEENFYISFSGGKDSTVVHHLVDIELCSLYYEPYNFVRTGCKGCPFSLNLQNDLETMERYFPAERKQCEIIWKPVYDEYRRLGYRLKKDEQLKLF